MTCDPLTAWHSFRSRRQSECVSRREKNGGRAKPLNQHHNGGQKYSSRKYGRKEWSESVSERKQELF